jgi:adenosine deaminase
MGGKRVAAFLVVLLAVRAFGAGDANEAATARRLAAIRNQPLALEAFLREMPKGADLHNHLSGSIYAESYLRWAAEDNFCLVLATMTLVQPTPQAPCDAVGGRPLAGTAIQNATVFNQAIDAMSMRNWPAGVNGHEHFFQSFAKFGAVSAAHTGDMIAEVASRAAAEHVSYLELMITSDNGSVVRLARETSWNPDLAQMRNTLLSKDWPGAIATARQRLDAAEARSREAMKCGTSQANAGCRVTIRYVAQVARAAPPVEVFAQILAGMDGQSIEPRVVGVNLVQPEDDAVAVRDFMLHMNIIDFLRPLYPKAHISLHAGELADGLVPPDVLRFHVRESIHKGHAERIGHGTSVMQEDDPYGLMRELAAKKVLVEINLTSNDAILGVKGARHPLRTYLQYGVPVAISTDDYGVARSSHTLEWLRAVQEHNLDYLTIKRMVRNSIDHAFADAATKARLTRDLESAFHQFEQRESAAAPAQ